MNQLPLLYVTSPDFRHNDLIPMKFTCDGKDINPALAIEGVPVSAKSLALIVDDPDAPHKTWVHWVVWNIPVTTSIAENTVPGEQGLNDFGRVEFGGPCPPSGVHRYFFKVYALDTTLDLPKSTTKEKLEHAMEGHILAYGELIGKYSRK
jgi:Raf kinase inhibitor-like YbhB/YbcL family protein